MPESLPEGVEAFHPPSVYGNGPTEMWPDSKSPGSPGAWIRRSDLPAIIDQAKREDLELVVEVQRELLRRARDAEAEERRRVSHGMNGAGPHSAMRAYDAAADLLTDLVRERKNEI